MSTMHEKGLKKNPQILTEFQWTFKAKMRKITKIW